MGGRICGQRLGQVQLSMNFGGVLITILLYSELPLGQTRLIKLKRLCGLGGAD